MKYPIIPIIILFLLYTGCMPSGDPEKRIISAGSTIEIQNYTHYVNPFIGTDGKGKTYPGATMPFGMVQLSPDNGRSGWDWISGYFYPDSILAGFSHTHLSGTGIGDLYDISYFTTIGNERKKDLDGDSTTLERYSLFSHASEAAAPGYYSVQLLDYDILVELSATRRVGIQKYTYANAGHANIYLDLGYARNWDATTQTELTVLNDSTIAGSRFSTGWAKDQRVYFVSRFSREFEEIDLPEGKWDKAEMAYDVSAGESILIKTALSSVSVENALINLEDEAKHWDFDEYADAAEAEWERELSKVRVKTYDDESLEKFYTALYQSMLAPTLFSDVNGEYKGADGNTQVAEGYDRYSTFSLWDTFRAAHPLFTILHPDRVPDMVNSMLDHYDEYGKLPVWDLAANETDMMIGYHAVPVIADAWLKGIKGFDEKKALEAMQVSANQDDFGLKFRRQYGYIPQEDFKESVSLDLEYSYDDWCIGQMAANLGEAQVASEFADRASWYKSHFDPETGFMRALDKEGNWTPDFDPLEYSDEYIEANAWQYTHFVPHDIEGLIELYGGKEPFIEKLDQLFTTRNAEEDLPVFITGMIGQYVHGNEPDHHVPYLYAMAGAPEKTQEMIRRISSTLQLATPDGIAGNEDCGQMSAWYIFSSLGFYPVNPCGGEYVLGSPLFTEVSIDVGDGKVLTIKAEGAEETPYWNEVLWNGEIVEGYSVEHQELMEGGELEFRMVRTINN